MILINSLLPCRLSVLFLFYFPFVFFFLIISWSWVFTYANMFTYAFTLCFSIFLISSLEFFSFFFAFSLFLFLYLCFFSYNWIANPSLHKNFILIMLFISSQHSVIMPLGLWNNQLGADYIKKNTAVINVAEELVGDKSVGKDNGQKNT